MMTSIRYLDWAGQLQIPIDRDFSQFVSKLAGERHCVTAEKFLVVLDSPYCAELRTERRRVEVAGSHGSSSTENNHTGRGGGRGRRRGNDFTRTEFQFASQQGDAGARPESNSATRVSAQRAGAPHFATTVGDSLFSAQQSRFFASIPRTHSAGAMCAKGDRLTDREQGEYSR